MALDTYAEIWNGVLLRAPDVGRFIAQDLVDNAFRRIAERRRWSWLVKFGQFIAPDAYATGTANVTQGSQTVTGNGTVWTADMVGRQFRVGNSTPIYTISGFTDATTITIDFPYGGVTGSSVGYRIYQCWYTVPTDFHSFITLWDPAMNWRLNLNVKQEEINSIDAQRSNTGNAYVVSYYDSNIFFPSYAAGVPTLPRYELWPHPTGRIFPFLYEARATDLRDADATLPRYIRGDLILEVALGEAASWPGTNGRKNAYFDMGISKRHDARAEFMVAEAERQDDETDMQDLMLQYNVPSLFAVPWGDSAWLQQHGPLW